MGRRTGFGRRWEGRAASLKPAKEAEPGDGQVDCVMVPDNDPLLEALIREHGSERR